MDKSRSIEELEDYVWLDFSLLESIEKRSYDIRKKPLSSLKPQDIKLALTQHLGIKFVVRWR